jgi:ferritin-like metal-binding protein YciE
MTKLDMAMRDLHDAEAQLVLDLERMGERHHADHEVVHVTRDLAHWSADHLGKLAGVAPKYGLELSGDAPHTNDLAAAVREKTSDLMGRRHSPSLMLLDDLRDLYGAASRVQLDWEVLAQAAQALEDAELVDLAESCRAQTQRQVTWAETKLKETAAQALVTP